MKTSARMFLLLAGFGVGAGVIYASLAKERAGMLLLFLFGIANIFLAVLMLKAGDPTESRGHGAHSAQGDEAHHEVHLPPPSVWPFVISVGAGVAGWGLLLRPVIFAIGLIVVVVGAAGWAGGFSAINRDLAAWGEVWRFRQYKNLDAISKELEAMRAAEEGAAPNR